MKVEDLKKELTAKIKDLIFEVLKDFDMSNYKILILFKDKYLKITILDGLSFKLYIFYINKLYIRIDKSILNKFNFAYYGNGKHGIFQSKDLIEECSVDDFIDILNSKPMQIITTLRNNKNILEEELKNILE